MVAIWALLDTSFGCLCAAFNPGMLGLPRGRRPIQLLEQNEMLSNQMLHGIQLGSDQTKGFRFRNLCNLSNLCTYLPLHVHPGSRWQ